jgi:hypothetical protein
MYFRKCAFFSRPFSVGAIRVRLAVGKSTNLDVEIGAENPLLDMPIVSNTNLPFHVAGCFCKVWQLNTDCVP